MSQAAPSSPSSTCLPHLPPLQPIQLSSSGPNQIAGAATPSAMSASMTLTTDSGSTLTSQYPPSTTSPASMVSGQAVTPSVTPTSTSGPTTGITNAVTARRYRVPDDLRRRAAVSCDRCKIRRARCVRPAGQDICSNCQRLGKPCESTLPRKHRIYGSLESLSLRFRALDGLVKGLFPDENTQDVATLFRLAAERQVSHAMPPVDKLDFASEIFDQRPAEGPSSSTAGPSSATGPVGTAAGPAQLPGLVSTSGSAPYTPLPGETHRMVSGAHSDAGWPTDTIDACNDSSAAGSPGVTPAQVCGVVEERLIATPQGQFHYIGPTSTFGFASNVRAIVARCALAPRCRLYRRDIGGALAQLHLLTSANRETPHDGSNIQTGPFGPVIPAAPFVKPGRAGSHSAPDNGDRDPLRDLLPSREDANELVNSYFEHVHPTNPVFHRASFEKVYQTLWPDENGKTNWTDDPGWTSCFLLVFLFGIDIVLQHNRKTIHFDRRAARDLLRQTLLSQLHTATCLVNTQALFLLHIFEHNAGERNLAWMLLGSATRMAMSIGMHRNLPARTFGIIEYEVRKRFWWTIYVAERLMSVILGRPSAISDSEVTIGLPDDALFGEDGPPPDFLEHQLRLIRIMSAIRSEVFGPVALRESLPDGDLVRTYLAGLDNWHDALPPALLPKWNSMRLCHRRSVLTLHLYYTFARSLVTRPFFLRKTETMIAELEKEDSDLTPAAVMGTLPPEIRADVNSLARSCLRSAEQATTVLLQMTNAGLFDCICWYDGYFVYHSLFILALDVLPKAQDAPEASDEQARKLVVKSVMQAVHRFNLGTTFRLILHVAAQLVAVLDPIETKDGISGVGADPRQRAASLLGMRQHHELQSQHQLRTQNQPVPQQQAGYHLQMVPQPPEQMGQSMPHQLQMQHSSQEQKLHPGDQDQIDGQDQVMQDIHQQPLGRGMQNEIQIVQQPAMLDLFPAAYISAPWDYFHLYSMPSGPEMEDVDTSSADPQASATVGSAVRSRQPQGQNQRLQQGQSAVSVDLPSVQIHDMSQGTVPASYEGHVFAPTITPVVFNSPYANFQPAMVSPSGQANSELINHQFAHRSHQSSGPHSQHPSPVRAQPPTQPHQVQPSFPAFHMPATTSPAQAGLDETGVGRQESQLSQATTGEATRPQPLSQQHHQMHQTQQPRLSIPPVASPDDPASCTPSTGISQQQQQQQQQLRQQLASLQQGNYLSPAYSQPSPQSLTAADSISRHNPNSQSARQHGQGQVQTPVTGQLQSQPGSQAGSSQSVWSQDMTVPQPTQHQHHQSHQQPAHSQSQAPGMLSVDSTASISNDGGASSGSNSGPAPSSAGVHNPGQTAVFRAINPGPAYVIGADGAWVSVYQPDTGVMSMQLHHPYPPS